MRIIILLLSLFSLTSCYERKPTPEQIRSAAEARAAFAAFERGEFTGRPSGLVPDRYEITVEHGRSEPYQRDYIQRGAEDALRKIR